MTLELIALGAAVVSLSLTLAFVLGRPRPDETPEDAERRIKLLLSISYDVRVIPDLGPPRNATTSLDRHSKG